MTGRTLAFVASLLACPAALAGDDPEIVFAKLHAAALAGDLEAMRSYAAAAERATMVLPEVPKAYSVTGKAVRKDGNAVELRAVGTADSVGLGYTQIYGVVGLVSEGGEWKVERLSWSIERPGEYPEGYVVVQGPAPQPRSSAEPLVPRFTLPPSPPEPSHLVNPKRADDAGRADPAPAPPAEPARPCTIKPVMSDEDLRACGARVP
ncbi:MAG TPA: hypothetical protein VFI86_04725 [Burkholderiales bacterium]|nr:hypothetical protein [Burkholderiales bacterium]